MLKTKSNLIAITALGTWLPSTSIRLRERLDAGNIYNVVSDLKCHAQCQAKFRKAFCSLVIGAGSDRSEPAAAAKERGCLCFYDLVIITFTQTPVVALGVLLEFALADMYRGISEYPGNSLALVRCHRKGLTQHEISEQDG